MRIGLFISYYFSKILTFVPLCHKYLRKHLLIKVNIKNIFWIHLQTFKISSRSKTGISLEIILNGFKCFIVSLIPL